MGAFLFWGFAPIYFKAVSVASPLEVLSHRVVWTVVLLGGLLAALGRLGGIAVELRRPGRLKTYIACTLLISANWLTFIWAVSHDHLLQASLGYYINPLVTIGLGVIFLSERLNRWQITAVVLAAAGVAVLVVGYGEVPWVSLVLAFSFGFYSLLRKRAAVDPQIGLQIETMLMLLPALAYLVVLEGSGEGLFIAGGWSISLLLVASGFVTAAPLILFMHGANRLTLTTIGVMQYIAPSLHFVLAVAVYSETLGTGQLITFAAIWLGLACYTGDAMVRRRQAARSARSAAAAAAAIPPEAAE
ncbi:MAG: EamA family transporter RarD [Rhodospirillaceae bacterium]|nr:EamA family transporter RarD [Rhodospirillaceae bacterium]MCA8933051.1 EamA family transporter RarD [Rhodospirillaceae bacterium]